MVTATIIYKQVGAPDQAESCGGCCFDTDQSICCTSGAEIQHIRCHKGALRYIWVIDSVSVSQ